jgi:predicted nucleic acid-binding protein
VALIVVDASVIIGFLDAADEHHEAAVAALDASVADDLVLPATAYAEVLVAPARKGSAAVDRVEEALSALTVQLEAITPAIARSAATLRARHRSLKLPDALVLATAEVLGAATVLTADRTWPRISRKVRLI